MGLPSSDLTVSRTIPLVLALGASLGSSFPTVSAFRIFEELIEYLRIIEFHNSLHILLQRLLILSKVVLNLIFSNFLPVPFSHDLSSKLRNLLYNERVLSWYWIIGHER
jgi:hypothetical protein